MKKSVGVIGVVVVLAAAYTGGAWYVGKQAQVTIQGAVEQGNQRLIKILGPDLSGRGIKLAVSEYKRHVFSSDIVYTLQLKDNQGEPVEYLLSDHLQHGPFPVNALKAGNFLPMLALSHTQMIPSAATQKWFDLLKGQSPVSAVTRIGFAGTASSVWQLKPLQLTEDGEKLSFSGGAFDMSFTNHFKDSTATGHFDSLEYADDDSGESVQIKGISLNSVTSSLNEQDTIKIASSARADSVLAVSSDAEPLLLEKAAITLDSVQKGTLLEGALRYDLERVQVGKADFGSVSLGTKIRDFDVNTLTDLALEYDRIRSGQGVVSDDDLELSEQDAKVLRDKLWAVLASNPTVAIDPFVWKNDQGESTFKLSVNLSSPANVSANDTVDTLLLQVIKTLDLDFSVAKPMFINAFVQSQSGSISEAEAKEIATLMFDQYTSRLSGVGLIKTEKNIASTAIKYANNSVDVNGKKMSVMELVQRAISAVM